MTPPKKLTEQEQVDQLISKLDPAIRPVIERLREIILSTDKLIGEQIKWNSPSFYYTGEMKPFDPREYKRDIGVLNLHRGRIMMVLPTGARIEDSTGLLEGDYKDGRRMIIFKDLQDVDAKKKALQGVIKKWLKGVEKV